MAHKILWSVGLVVLATPAGAATTNLVCEGNVGKDKSTTTTAIGTFGAGVATTERRINFEDSVSIRLNDDNTGEVRVPRKLLPMVRDGGKDGWFPMIELAKREDEITGKVRMNVNYKPKIRLDRITGRMTLQGVLGDFAGTCEPYDPATVQRKF